MYGIMRTEKRSRNDVYGIQIEANRTQEDHLRGREFNGSDIDWSLTERNVFNDCLEYYCHQLAIDTKSSHKVRKTVFSNLFDKGVDIEEVMKIAGHRHKTTTLKYYLFSVKRKEDKRKRMNEALNSSHCPFGQPKFDCIKKQKNVVNSAFFRN